jgi:predicted ATPase
MRSAALVLYEDRAAAARPGFRITADNAQEVARICQWLDGLPLGIELAAV